MLYLIPIAVAVVLYVIFLMWYRGRRKPLSQIEINEQIKQMKKARKMEDVNESEILQGVREVLSQDDGKEFFMINLMKFKDLDPESEAMKAHKRYSKAIAPLLFRNGSFPIYLSNVQGRFIFEDGDVDWDQVGIIRYRTRRDYLKFVVAASKLDMDNDKWISLEKTHVFPSNATFYIGAIRLGVFIFLTILTLISVMSILLI